jgi:hypothetical protein
MTDQFDFPEEVTGMQWEAVDSSQISEIGYESGAEYPLGIKFLAGKKSPASQYRYKNVDYDLFNALVASPSIESYFGKNIKSRPDLYPFVKVETENPPQPPSSPNGGGSRSAKASTSSAPAETSQETLESESPGSALALIDSMADDLLFTPGKVTDEQLATMRSDWLTEAKKYDISTDKARTELKRFARPLQKLRTGIEARAKELTGATKRKIAAIDAEKRRLVQIVGDIEGEVLAPLTAWEQEEEARKVRLAGIVKSIADSTQPHLYPTVGHLELAINALEKYDTSTMQEYKLSAESAIAASLRVLKPELERRKVAEQEKAELDRLRAESAARAEQDRINAAAEKLAQAKIQAAVEAAKVETRQEVVAELKAPVEQIQTRIYKDEPQPFVYPEIPVASEDETFTITFTLDELYTLQSALEVLVEGTGQYLMLRLPESIATHKALLDKFNLALPR